MPPSGSSGRFWPHTGAFGKTNFIRLYTGMQIPPSVLAYLRYANPVKKALAFQEPPWSVDGGPLRITEHEK